MPFYEVHHSYPLSADQQQTLASAITNLHATTFSTPSIFVHVQFVRADDTGKVEYFMAGQRRTGKVNRIVGILRTSPTRTKADFDKLAIGIEEVWYNALDVKPPGPGEVISAANADKKLGLVAFTPMITAREAGFAAPEAGKEGEWFKQELPHFKKLAEAGDEDIVHMLNELKERDDLKKLLG